MAMQPNCGGCVIIYTLKLLICVIYIATFIYVGIAVILHEKVCVNNTETLSTLRHCESGMVIKEEF